MEECKAKVLPYVCTQKGPEVRTWVGNECRRHSFSTVKGVQAEACGYELAEIIEF